MTIFNYFTSIFQFLVLIPFAFLCYMPMKNQLKYSLFKIFVAVLMTFSIVIPISTFILVYFNINGNMILFPFIILFFFLYHNTLKTERIQNLTIYCFICALMAFPADFSYGFDAWLYPNGNAANFGWESGILQFAISSGLAILTAYPLNRWGSFLIDNLKFKKIWYIMLPFPLVFLLIAIMFIPHKYETMHTNNIFILFFVILGFLMFLMLFICILFYHISQSVLSATNDRERIRFFEMQQSQYIAQKNYMEQTEKLRHDFRQSIHTLKELSDMEDWEELKKYLCNYEKILPENRFTLWCENSAVNAILNYYSNIASENDIKIKWKISLTENLMISSPELCSLLGNILENAVAGCITENKENRYHYLSVMIKNEINLYIVSVNSFDGNVNMRDNCYISTKRNEKGIGISSIEMTVKKYNGIAKFYHNSNEFYVDVMLKVKNMQ